MAGLSDLLGRTRQTLGAAQGRGNETPPPPVDRTGWVSDATGGWRTPTGELMFDMSPQGAGGGGSHGMRPSGAEPGPTPAQQLGGTNTEAVGDAMFNKAAADINQTFDDQARGLNENAFARGIGSGTIVPYYRGRLEEGRGKAIGQARQLATIGAGGEARANQEALRRLFETALGASQRNRALNLEGERLATTTDLANRTLTQRGGEFDRLLTQRGGEFDRTLNQRAQEFTNVQDLAKAKLVAGDDAELLNLLLRGGIGLGGLLTSPIPAGGSTVGGALVSGGGSLLSGLLSLFANSGGGTADLLSDPAFLEAAGALI